MMADSGARGSVNQIRQLAGMRGLMASPSGKIIELPIQRQLPRGPVRCWSSSCPPTAPASPWPIRPCSTADSGYMTRRLVDVSQENDRPRSGLLRRPRRKGARPEGAATSPATASVIESLEDRIRGRVAAEDVIDPATGEVIVHVNETDHPRHGQAHRGRAASRKSPSARVLTCQSAIGVCARCYGANMTNGKLVDVGEAVGIIAAQSIGEPGTQLTMRTFHTGGVATGDGYHPGSSPRGRAVRSPSSPSAKPPLRKSPVSCTFPPDTKKRRELIITSRRRRRGSEEIPHQLRRRS